MQEKLNIFSVSVDTAERKDILQKMSDMLCGNSQNKIFTPNTEMLLAAKKDHRLADMLNSAELLIPDGTGVKIASQILNSPLSERLSGIDLAAELLTIAAQTENSVYLLGGKEGVAEAAAKNLKNLLPSLDICGTHHGYFDKSGEENDRLLSDIRAAAPQILFVCFGFPAQERWICENLTPTALPSVRIAMGLGGSLDVWSGNKKRAPKALQAMGLEWLWRSAFEPKRLKIFLEIPKFLYFSLLERQRSIT